MIRRCATIVATIWLLFAGSATSLAAPVLDQSNDVPSGASALLVGRDAPLGTAYFPAQTLTVGLTGLLARVEIDVWRLTGSGALTVSLFSVIQEFNPPVFTAPLASIVLSGGDVTSTPGTIALDFSPAGVVLRTGDRLAIGLAAGGTDTFAWAANYPNSYDGGVSFSFRGGFGQMPIYNLNFDTAFRTFVDQAVAVPEPPSLLVLAACLAAGLIARRMRARWRA